MGKDINDPDFIDCLKKNRIRNFSQGRLLVDKELDTSEKDLLESVESFKNKKYKWATIQSYYSMFHSARALLYFENFREKSHSGLIIALRALYVNAGKLNVGFVEGLQKAKNLREDADYYDQWSEIGAKEILDLAKEFLKISREILVRN